MSQTKRRPSKLLASWVSPQVNRAIRTFEKSACRDIRLAKLVLGLFGFVGRSSRTKVFPDFHWANTDIWQLPPRLRAPATVILQWSLGRKVILNEMLMSERRIVTAIRALLKNSPFGRRRRKIATWLRQQYLYQRDDLSNATDGLVDVDVLPEMVGRPISDGTIRLVQGFRPVRIEILRHNDPWTFSHLVGLATIRLEDDGFTVKSITLTVAISQSSSEAIIIDGELDEYSATGTEGLHWVIEDFDGLGLEKLHWIKAGDHLTVQDRLGRKLWSGVINCDRKAGWKRYPRNPQYGQPCALGYWIHWTQKGFSPDAWARLFVRPEHDKLRGILVRKVVPKMAIASKHGTAGPDALGDMGAKGAHS